MSSRQKIEGKPCTVKGCTRPRWARGLCQHHDMQEHPEKYRINSRSVLKRSKPLKSNGRIRSTRKAPIKQYSRRGAVRKSKEGEMMRALWDDRADHRGWCRCEECAKWLREFSPAYMHHALPKKNYPEHQDNPNVIIIYCLDHHNQVEFGDAKGMKTYKKIEQIKQHYGRDDSSATASN